MSELEQLRQRVFALEAARDVSACLHEYMQLCDYLNEGFDLDPLMALFTEDAIWEGKGKTTPPLLAAVKDVKRSGTCL